VALTVAAIDVVWLFPLAWGACVWPSFGLLFAVAAVAPLVASAKWESVQHWKQALLRVRRRN
jgi:hypothetical protein